MAISKSLRGRTAQKIMLFDKKDWQSAEALANDIIKRIELSVMRAVPPCGRCEKLEDALEHERHCRTCAEDGCDRCEECPADAVLASTVR